MAKTYTWINTTKNITTTQDISEKEVNALGHGYLFVTRLPASNWGLAGANGEPQGVVAQIWRDLKGRAVGDVCTIGDGVFVKTLTGSKVELNKKAYCATNGELTTDDTLEGAIEVNAYVTEVDVDLIAGDSTSIKGARITFNSVL